MAYQGSTAVGEGERIRAKRFTASELGVFRSSTHSQTLPSMLTAPYGLAPAGLLLTCMTPFGLATLTGGGVSGLSPHGYMRPSVPRAAFSHSCEVGRRLPAHLANSCASRKLTSTIGSAGRSPTAPAGMGSPVSFENRVYSAKGTSVLSI